MKTLLIFKPLVFKENLALGEAARRWKARFVDDDIKTPSKAWKDFLIVPPKHFYPQEKYDVAFEEYEVKLKASKVDQYMATKKKSFK